MNCDCARSNRHSGSFSREDLVALATKSREKGAKHDRSRSHFAHGKQVASYFGLIPREYSCGGRGHF